MPKIDKQIITIDENIQQNIEAFSPRERSLSSQDTPSQLSKALKTKLLLSFIVRSCIGDTIAA